MGWDPEIPICLPIVYGSFHATMVELVHCYKLYGPVKAENICSLTLDRKRFADPNLTIKPISHSSNGPEQVNKQLPVTWGFKDPISAN